MKKCPQCRASYGDEMAFCLEDGSALLIADEEPTVVFQNPAVPVQPPVKQGVSPIFAYLTVGLLTLILIGGGAAAIIYWQKTAGDPPPNNGVTNNADTLRTSPTPLQPTPLTAEAVRNLMETWEKAQDTRNFALYKSCYDPSFRGTKRTAGGSVSQYNYSQWLDDRQKMMSRAKYMDVRMDKMRISAADDAATVEFEQYFSTTGYADFGPKVIKVKMTENGAKIIYEELKSSTPVTD